MERIRFITHSGKQILLVDLSTCSPAEVERLVRSLPDHVTAQPLESVLLCADFTGASFNGEALRTMKEVAVFDKPHIRKTAWVGAESLPSSFRDDVSKFSRRKFPEFKSIAEALDWLTKD
ncbi:MAG: hypothetical protein WA172_01910 [Terriglobales bacterium]